MKRNLIFTESAPAPMRIVNHDMVGCMAEGVGSDQTHSECTSSLSELGDPLWDPILEGKIQCLIAGPETARQRLLPELQRRL